MTVSRSFNLR